MATSGNPSLRRGVQIEIVSNIWMIIEAGVAIGSGIVAHSLALAAFGTDSVIELVTGSVLLWRLTLHARGARVEYVERAERVSSWVVGISLLVLAVYIIIAALMKLVSHRGADDSYLGLGLAVASGIIMPYLSRVKKRIGWEISSPALRSDGSCSMVCAYMSWILLAGLALTSLYGWWWIDSITALAMVYYVVKEGWEAVEVARGHEDGCHCG